jgi:hypothetical protein
MIALRILAAAVLSCPLGALSLRLASFRGRFNSGGEEKAGGAEDGVGPEEQKKYAPFTIEIYPVAVGAFSDAAQRRRRHDWHLYAYDMR